VQRRVANTRTRRAELSLGGWPILAAGVPQPSVLRLRVLTVPRGPAGVARLDDYASSPRILPDEVWLG
jgi:hypothetical protein